MRETKPTTNAGLIAIAVIALLNVAGAMDFPGVYGASDDAAMTSYAPSTGSETAD